MGLSLLKRPQTLSSLGPSVHPATDRRTEKRFSANASRTPEPPRSSRQALARHPALKDLNAELLRTTEISHAGIDIAAVRVEVLDRVPVREMVFANHMGEWELLLSDKSLVRGWRRVVEGSLRQLGDSSCSVDGTLLAQDLARLLVDPDPRYGVVISSSAEIPTDYQSSHVLRDLERRSVEPPQIRSTLLRKAPSGIRSPRTNCVDEVAQVGFYTWHYFGGEVASWVVVLGPSPTIKRKVLAEGVGSYDYYY